MIWDGVIVGAGISALWLASELQRQNKKIVLIEKSSGLGGRIATRRSPPCIFDHGAQFIKTPSVFPAGASHWFSQNGFDYYTFAGGMTQWPKQLSQNLGIRKSEKVLTLQEASDFIEVTTDLGLKYRCKKLFITAPLPQGLEILSESGLSFPEELAQISYAKALVGLFHLDPSALNIKLPPYQGHVNENIFSVSDQQSKNVSPEPALTVVMTPSFSEKNFDDPDAESLEKTTQALLAHIALSPSQADKVFLSRQLKKWRFSHPLQTYAKPFELVGSHKNIVLLGDAFGGPSINGALRSAEAVAKFSADRP